MAWLNSSDQAERSLKIAAGGLIVALFAFVVLFVNVPPGYNTPQGLSLASVEIFRAALPYPTFEISAATFTRTAMAIVVVLWLAYFVAIAVVVSGSLDSARGARLVFGGATIATVLLTFYLPCLLSADLFHYGLFGRMVAFYDLNPYVDAGTTIRADPIWGYSVWREMTTQYGPTWTLIEAVVARLAGDNILATVVLFKVIAAIAHLGGAAIVFALGRKLSGDGLRPLVLFAWNPVLLIEAAGSGHNDATMLALAMAGLMLVVSGWLMIGASMMMAASLVKYLPLLLIFLTFTYVMSRQRTRADAALVAGKAGGAMLLTTAALFAPFLTGMRGPGHFLEAIAPTFNPMMSPLVEALRTTVGSGWMNGAFVVGTLIAGARLLRNQATYSDVSTAFGVATLIYVYFIFGASFLWYMVTPIAACSLGARTRANFFGLAGALAISLSLSFLYGQLLPMK